MSSTKKIVFVVEAIKGFDDAEKMIETAIERAIGEEWSGELNNGWCKVKWDFVSEEIEIKNFEKVV